MVTVVVVVLTTGRVVLFLLEELLCLVAEVVEDVALVVVVVVSEGSSSGFSLELSVSELSSVSESASDSDELSLLSDELSGSGTSLLSEGTVVSSVTGAGLFFDVNTDLASPLENSEHELKSSDTKTRIIILMFIFSLPKNIEGSAINALTYSAIFYMALTLFYHKRQRLSMKREKLICFVTRINYLVTGYSDLPGVIVDIFAAD